MHSYYTVMRMTLHGNITLMKVKGVKWMPSNYILEGAQAPWCQLIPCIEQPLHGYTRGVHEGVHEGGTRGGTRGGYTRGVHEGGTQGGYTRGIHEGGTYVQPKYSPVYIANMLPWQQDASHVCSNIYLILKYTALPSHTSSFGQSGS